MNETERSFNLDVTTSTIFHWLKNNKTTEKLIVDDNNVSFYELYDVYGNEVSTGSGKCDDYHIGGLAEAIEHFYTINQKSSTLVKKSSHITNQKSLNICAILSGLSNFNEDFLAVLQYKGWRDHAAAVHVPQIFVNPWLIKDPNGLNEAERYLARYSTNSGTALTQALH